MTMTLLTFDIKVIGEKFSTAQPAYHRNIVLDWDKHEGHRLHITEMGQTIKWRKTIHIDKAPGFFAAACRKAKIEAQLIAADISKPYISCNNSMTEHFMNTNNVEWYSKKNLL